MHSNDVLVLFRFILFVMDANARAVLSFVSSDYKSAVKEFDEAASAPGVHPPNAAACEIVLRSKASKQCNDNSINLSYIFSYTKIACN